MDGFGWLSAKGKGGEYQDQWVVMVKVVDLSDLKK